MEIICINDKNRPNEIPTSKWVKKGETYTIVTLVKMIQQNGLYGVKLAEIDNDDMYPYSFFRLDRFAVTEEELLKLVEIGELEEELI